jgi:hypothetical protein
LLTSIHGRSRLEHQPLPLLEWIAGNRYNTASVIKAGEARINHSGLERGVEVLKRRK